MKFQFKVIPRSNLYARLLVIIAIVQLIYMLATESDFLIGDPNVGPKYGAILAATLSLLYFYYSIQLLEELKHPRLVIKVFWIYFFVGLFVTYFVANPFVDFLSPGQKKTIFPFFHIFNGGIFAYVGWAILKDIFSSHETQSDHIWGAICVYFLTIAVFAEFYEIITTINQDLFGQQYELGFPNYVHCQMFSINAMAGVDLIYVEASDLMKKFGAIQNIFGNLFLVVILGRLLSHPLKKNGKI